MSLLDFAKTLSPGDRIEYKNKTWNQTFRATVLRFYANFLIIKVDDWYVTEVLLDLFDDGYYDFRKVRQSKFMPMGA